jgi:hypothetical protein
LSAPQRTQHARTGQATQQALLAVAGAPGLAAGPAGWAVNERQAEALVRAHEALEKARESGRVVAWAREGVHLACFVWETQRHVMGRGSHQ